MTEVTKKLEGFVNELNPTTIMVGGKLIYLPQEKREYVSEQNLSIADAVRIKYTEKGNLISVERLSKGDTDKLGKLVAKVIDAEAEQKKKMHINNPTTVAAPPVSEVHIQPEPTKKEITQPGVLPVIEKSGVHIQKPEVTWITEREKNNTIIIESLLARSVEIVNANYKAFAMPPYSPEEFMGILDARCVLVERVTDQLFKYVKKKVQDEQKQQ